MEKSTLLLFLMMITFGCNVENEPYLQFDQKQTQFGEKHELTVKVLHETSQIKHSKFRGYDGEFHLTLRKVELLNKTNNSLFVPIIDDSLNIAENNRSQYYSTIRKDIAKTICNMPLERKVFMEIEPNSKVTVFIEDPFIDADSIHLEIPIKTENEQYLAPNTIILTRK